jgi:hypothetical protein
MAAVTKEQLTPTMMLSGYAARAGASAVGTLSSPFETGQVDITPHS